MYALYIGIDSSGGIFTRREYIAKINATTRTIINYSLVEVTGAMIGTSNAILLIENDLYLLSDPVC
jgi:xanthine/uracil/vitamin C permease (AzgA family)